MITLQSYAPVFTAASELFAYLLPGAKHIALTGGGGKTTLLYALGNACSAMRQSVLLYTTTHIMAPAHFCRTAELCERDWEQGLPAVLGAESVGKKLTIPSERELSLALAACDLAICEADGAKRSPMKVPAAHEPQIPERADTVVSVVGLSALGKRLQDVCFRAELLGVSGAGTVDIELLEELLVSERFGRKGVGERNYRVVLNQADADCPERIEVGRRLALRLISRGIPTALCAFPPELRAKEAF